MAIATARAKDEQLGHVRFVQADLASFKPDRLYDAVIARHILIHTPDSVALIRRARTCVKLGGFLAFQEFDLSLFSGPQFDDLPMWVTCGKAVAMLFDRAGLPIRAGALLYTWFLEAALPVPECRLEYLVGGGESRLFYEWLAETMRSLMPKMLALGILQPDTIDIEQLQDQLRRECVRVQRPCIGGPMGAAFVRTPM